MTTGVTVRKGLLIVWTDIPANLEYEFNDWYNREHMRERILGIDGFIRGRRFIATRGAPRYLAVYEADNAGVMTSEPYRALVRNPDKLSRKFIPRFEHTLKGICDIVAEAGEAEGAAVGIVPLVRSGGREDELRSWVMDTLIPDLMRQHGVVAARYAEKNAGALAEGTAQHLRPTDKFIDALLMIEAASEVDLAHALSFVARYALVAHGGQPDGEPGQFSVIYTLHVPRSLTETLCAPI